MSNLITLTRGATTIALDPDLRWIDDLSWSPVAMSKTRSITGAWIIDSMPRTGGQSITLAGDGVSGMLTRATLNALRALLLPAEAELTLLHLGVTHTVIWDHGDGEESEAIKSEPWTDYSDPIDEDLYCNVQLRFLKKA